jgi:hypothetical protein
VFRFFEYLQGFDQEQCLEAADVTACSLSVMDKIDHCDYQNFAACVGDDVELESDTVNDKLEAQLAWAKEKNIVSLAEFPLLEIGSKYKYEGDWDTGAILQAYCDLFSDDNMHPISCDICLPCQDVRRCLWMLECDGTPFDPQSFLSSYGSLTTTAPTSSPSSVVMLPPVDDIATTSTTTTSSPTTSSSSQNNNEQGGQTANSGVILTFFVLSVVLSAVTAAFFVYRNRRTRYLMAEIQAEHLVSDGFRDGDGYSDVLELPSSSSRDGSQSPPNSAFLPEVS